MNGAATPYSILIITVLCLFIITYFVSYHAEKAEALQVALYADEALNDGELESAPKVMDRMYEDDIRFIHSNVSFCNLLCE